MIIYKYVADPLPLPLYYVHQYINNHYFIPRFYTTKSTCLRVHGVQKSVFVKSSFACIFLKIISEFGLSLHTATKS